MKSAWIAFEKDKSFGGWLVRAVSGYPYNHVAIVYRSVDFDNFWTLEAVTAGVRSKPLATNRRFAKVFKAKYDMTPDIRASLGLVGQGYDFTGLIVFGCILLAWKWFRAKIRMPRVTFKGQMCSEYLARVLGNRYLSWNENPQWTRPEDIAILCSSKTEDFEEVPDFIE